MRRAAIGWTLLCGLACATAAPAAGRWYSAEQVAEGGALFAQHCAECHGAEAQGTTPEWRQLTPEGLYPPPPLNGTAHAWHHPLPVLRRVIADGGVPLGGSMPGFKEKLAKEQVDALIAFFQSRWSDRIYATWLERNPLPVGASTPEPGTPEGVTHWVRERLPNRTIGNPEPTPVEGVFSVPVDASLVFISADGRYIFTGDLIDLQTNENLGQQARSGLRKAALAGFPSGDRVIFPATGEERAVIAIFTDTTCPFCRKLHAEVPKLQQAGVRVEYLPFARSGLQSPGAEGMRAVWCADDRVAAMDIAKEAKAGGLGRGDCAAGKLIEVGTELAREVGVNGTPAVILADGTLLSGYRPAEKLLEALGLTP